jgi:hypothetical protein
MHWLGHTGVPGVAPERDTRHRRAFPPRPRNAAATDATEDPSISEPVLPLALSGNLAAPSYAIGRHPSQAKGRLTLEAAKLPLRDPAMSVVPKADKRSVR